MAVSLQHITGGGLVFCPVGVEFIAWELKLPPAKEVKKRRRAAPDHATGELLLRQLTDSAALDRRGLPRAAGVFDLLGYG